MVPAAGVGSAEFPAAAVPAAGLEAAEGAEAVPVVAEAGAEEPVAAEAGAEEPAVEATPPAIAEREADAAISADWEATKEYEVAAVMLAGGVAEKGVLVAGL